MIGVDLWNGSSSQLREFQLVTQVDFPLLQLGGRTPEIPWGLGLENVIIVDRGVIVRGIYGMDDRTQMMDMIDLINDPVPLPKFSPQSLYYGLTAQVGETRQLPVTVSNIGLKDLVIQNIKPSNDQVSVDQTSFTIPPGGRAPFPVTVQPPETGTLRGTLELTTNVSGTVRLEISPIEVEGVLPRAIVMPVTLIDYGTVEVGRSRTLPIEIRNDGAGLLTVTRIESDLSEVSFSDASLTIASGESSTILVTLEPGLSGSIAGQIDIYSDDPERPVLKVSLVGAGEVIPADTRTDFDNSGVVDFTDFLGFSGAFGTSDPTHDVDGNGTVDFSDFLIFVENFGRSTQ